MIGGYNPPEIYLDTTELIDQNGSTQGPNLPYTFAYHCSSYMNTTHSIIIGGYVDGPSSGKSVIVQMSDFTMTDGPILNSNKDERIACGNFQHANGTKYVILAGGFLVTTQLLNVDSINEGWHSGIKFIQQVKSSIKIICTMETVKHRGTCSTSSKFGQSKIIRNILCFT